MKRLLLFLLLGGLLPLEAQNSVDDSAKIQPSTSPDAATVDPAAAPSSTAVSDNAPLPASPVIHPRLDRFSVSPSTIREGMAYRQGAQTVLLLSAPATAPLVCQVVSSNPEVLTASPVTFQKGQVQQKGPIEIKWKNVAHDCQVVVKVYDVARPENIFRARVYLYKSHTGAVAK